MQDNLPVKRVIDVPPVDLFMIAVLLHFDRVAYPIVTSGIPEADNDALPVAFVASVLL
jgi:hypothetical protein